MVALCATAHSIRGLVPNNRRHNFIQHKNPIFSILFVVLLSFDAFIIR